MSTGEGLRILSAVRSVGNTSEKIISQKRLMLKNYYARNKKCHQCGKDFSKPPKETWRQWVEHKFCGNECRFSSYKGVSKNVGEANGQWKGSKVKYGALHDYIKYHKLRPEKCDNCNEIKKLDLANISGKYKRSLDDWEWLCRRCHMIKDGRLKKLSPL